MSSPDDDPTFDSLATSAATTPLDARGGDAVARAQGKRFEPGAILRTLLGPGPMISEWMMWVFFAILGALVIVLGLVLARLIFRRVWLAMAVASLFLMMAGANFMNTSSQWMWLFPLAQGIAMAAGTVWLGLLPLVIARLVWFVLNRVPFTGEFSDWAAMPSNWSIALLLVLACFGFYASRAGQPLFGQVLKD